MFTSWSVPPRPPSCAPDASQASLARRELTRWCLCCRALHTGPTPRWSSLGSRASTTCGRPGRPGWTTWSRSCSPRRSSESRLSFSEFSGLHSLIGRADRELIKRGLSRYHYLLQSPSDLLPLDDYVLNTGPSLHEPTAIFLFELTPRTLRTHAEAHPFLSNPSITPGSQNLWSFVPSFSLPLSLVPSPLPSFVSSTPYSLNLSPRFHPRSPSTPPSHPLHPEDTSRPDRSGTSAQLWATHKRLPRPHTVVAQPAGKVEVFRPVAPLRNGPGKQQAVGGGMGEYPTRTGQAEVETDG